MIKYRSYMPGDELKISGMIKKVFNALIAPDFDEEGINIFCDFIKPENIKERLEKNCFAFAAEDQNEIIGYIEIDETGKIRLFFTDLKRLGKGIGKTLFRKAYCKLREKYADSKSLTVHSSIYAQSIYQKLGFQKTGELRKENGILYIPMEMKFLKKI